MKMKKTLGVILALLVCASISAAENRPGEVQLAWGDTGPYSMVERSDWSRYDNGKYTGHVYREVRANLNSSTAPDGYLYQGHFYVLEETLRDMRQSARSLDAIVPVAFKMKENGAIMLNGDRGFPSLRNFPVLPVDPVLPGEKWIAEGSRAVDPLNEGLPVVVPLVAEYQYRGIEELQGIKVYHIFAKYASRYRVPSGVLTYGDPGARMSRRTLANMYQSDVFTQLTGTHEVDIYLRVTDGLPIMMRDNLDETYTWADGATVRFRGFTLTFNEGSLPLNRELDINRGILTNISKDLDGIGVEEVPEGIKLTMQDIRFIADTSLFLPVEQPRLDLIAGVLRQAPTRTFLVEGHTASTGQPENEMQLSLERARRFIEEMNARGISADRFIYKGYGGTRPAAPNTNEADRAKNRRVEITILE